MSDEVHKDSENKLQAALRDLRPIFAKAAVGDFSEDVFLPDKDDEAIELYMGVQIMLDVIRSQIKDERDLTRMLESHVRRLRESQQSIVDKE